MPCVLERYVPIRWGKLNDDCTIETNVIMLSSVAAASHDKSHHDY